MQSQWEKSKQPVYRRIDALCMRDNTKPRCDRAALSKLARLQPERK